MGIKVTEKLCNTCDIVQPLDNYQTAKKGLYGKAAVCKKCFKEIYTKKRNIKETCVKPTNAININVFLDRINSSHKDFCEKYMLESHFLYRAKNKNYLIKKVNNGYVIYTNTLIRHLIQEGVPRVDLGREYIKLTKKPKIRKKRIKKPKLRVKSTPKPKIKPIIKFNIKQTYQYPSNHKIHDWLHDR